MLLLRPHCLPLLLVMQRVCPAAVAAVGRWLRLPLAPAGPAAEACLLLPLLLPPCQCCRRLLHCC